MRGAPVTSASFKAPLTPAHLSGPNSENFQILFPHPQVGTYKQHLADLDAFVAHNPLKVDENGNVIKMPLGSSNGGTLGAGPIGVSPVAGVAQGNVSVTSSMLSSYDERH